MRWKEAEEREIHIFSQQKFLPTLRLCEYKVLSLHRNLKSLHEHGSYLNNFEYAKRNTWYNLHKLLNLSAKKQIGQQNASPNLVRKEKTKCIFQLTNISVALRL